ncbi:MULTISPECIES: hypothetical protein [Nostoc]|uniref:Uncharacterized protein n=1 Tax=Nostoc paludosum FACHB-159 TaxID=2692908 RepID=A0ABR8KPE2_9NOSO|nr:MULTISPECIES: hypothetical protein [Nostoc]MBD2683272.1 hypothetical protein [Nostoc sp. FACHB-857]MBD2739587.1 hypothetical protein [Nostoc paludosum FACHB-159]
MANFVNTEALKAEDTMRRSQFGQIPSSSTLQMRVYCGKYDVSSEKTDILIKTTVKIQIIFS